jgi:hypothetical protein
MKNEIILYQSDEESEGIEVRLQDETSMNFFNQKIHKGE